jgi:hypothetical protein
MPKQTKIIMSSPISHHQEPYFIMYMVLTNHHQVQLCIFSIMLYAAFIKKLYNGMITMFMQKESLTILTTIKHGTASTLLYLNVYGA